MKRNWDTIREILTRLEDLPDTDSMLDLSDFPEDGRYEYSYHVELLIEAGIVEGQMSRTLGRGPTHFFARRLTWPGHEFLDSIRSDTVWNKTKKTFAAKGIDMTFDLVRSVASDISLALIRGASGV
ncbi:MULTISPECIES: DUF2513 domain-containing protein [Pseudomonadaceae]|uniref:DUF2513 domain-containing protein n=1 Tax=Pseudomonadaceae TaxID=135621 RepID=UPI0015E34DC3|nr:MULTISPECIES: DUF2513 domain-containing protein [Pseudomonadaceae]MBA1276174.1 DUF2513 domain-containing protein [Stutzerimonas stutzeri]MBC8648684.1 DUF2513 domain-containing protein [Pseudomonas sp. MT4]QXY92667.1 DUF2513 domain-containing protein [Pseudomonas sp. MTM4]